jgi:CheY-like chemotaxis protein
VGTLSAGTTHTGKPRVLVVDDSQAIRDLITVNLELEGFEVRSAAEGAAALDVLASWRPDVMTLDVVMTGLDGLSTLERLRADPVYADLPVVLVTARAQPSDRDRGSLLGADAYVPKPFEPADLVAVVARLAAEGRRSTSG